MTTGIRPAIRRSGRTAKAAFRGGCAFAALLGSIGVTGQAQAQIAGANGLIADNASHRSALIGIEDVPQFRASGMPVQNMPISAPVPNGVAPTHTLTPAGMLAINQPQTTAGLIAIDHPQAVGPRSSAARAFQANAVSASGGATVSPSSSADVVTVSGSETFINWTPLDTAISDDSINILPGGTSLTFVGPVSGYTILNRIVPTGTTSTGDLRAIAFGGAVDSRLGASDGAIGGNIWFYSPGGIIAGATSTFDVGSLVLTTNDINTDGGLFGTDGEIRFEGATDSSAAVVIESGAQINAANEDSYVALVAPRVVQGGTVDVNGSTAYIAAEQADLTINEGLFDIVVTVGTTDPNGVVHTGTTTGPAEVPTPAGPGGAPPAMPDPHAIYLVAVAKNDAVTMLVSGNLGYTAAVGATQEDGEIILSGGYNVSSGGSSDAPMVEFADEPVNGNAVTADFGASDLTVTNELTSQTTGAIDLTFSGTTFEAQQGLTLRSDESIDLTLNNGGLSVGGNLVLDASNTGPTDLTPGSNGQDTSGGTITVDIGDGGLLSANNISFLANATAGLGVASAGTATGGTIDITVSGTGAITTGIMLASAAAKDATQSISALQTQIGGDSIGGSIALNVSGGALTATQLALDTSAAAASGISSAEASNDATAGTISANFTGGTHNIDSLTLQTTSQGAESSDATGASRDGLASGGTASLLVDSATLNVANSLRINADTSGQTSIATSSAASLTVRNSGTLAIGATLDISTSASGGNLGVENQAGTIDILADGASLTFDDLFLDASSFLGQFGGANPADAAAGGFVTITSTGGGQIAGNGFSAINVNANATSASDGATGQGGTILFDANGGTIQIGGTSFVDANGVGNSNTDPTDLDNRGMGAGGTITYRIRNAGTMTFANVFASSDGSVQFDVEGGGAEPVGEGGIGFGGQVIFDLIDGTFNANSFNIGADGSGGPGGGDVVATPTLGVVALDGLDYSGSPTGFGPMGYMPFALPVDPGANGGDGTGGTVTFNLNGGTATVTNLTISADGFGGAGGFGDGDSGIGAGNGGNGIGGTATFNAITGTLTITNTLTVASNGTGGNGGFGDGADGGSGGDGFGGGATFDLDGTSTISAATVVVSTDGFGGAGGNTGDSFGGLVGGPGGDGGNATGGDAVFNNTAGTLSFGTLTAQAIGTGGDGGSNSGFSVGQAVDDGGDGGDGTGGTATINLNQDDLTSPAYIVDANGFGGTGGSGLNGGNGGVATGGTAALNVNDAQILLDDPTIRAIATGGDGGFSDGIGGNGGSGGNGTGGTARLEVSGANGSIPVGIILLQSDGLGGDGSAGGGNFTGGSAGDGGDGGDGTGGSSELIARTGGTLTITNAGFVVSSIGLGGTGGVGGDVDMVSGGAPGDGGDGGDGTGGSPTLLAQGGTITANDILLAGTGTGGNGGAGGTDTIVQIGADGNGGDGVGGNPVIEVQEGSPGIITLGATSMLANGTGGTGAVAGTSFGGRIDIIDTSTDPAGLITLASLDAQALTNANDTTSGFFLAANSGPITVIGDADITVDGNAEFAFDGDGQMTVGGNMTVSSGASILLSHINNNVPTNSLDIVGTFDAIAQIDFNAMAGSRIVSGGTTNIRAEGNASAADLTAFGRIDLSAGQDAMLGNGAVTGGPLVVVRIDAGSDNDPTSPLYDPQYNATVTGTVTSTGNVLVFAGGNAIFQAGADVSADNRIQVRTGDDIIVESGATISAGLNPNVAPTPGDPFGDLAILNLDAGGLAPSLISPILTPISSIIVAGTLEATNTAVVLNADAIDGLGGTINASSISADVNNAPSNAVIAAVGQSDDNGLLSANCLEGNICLGTLGADNRIEIGQVGLPIRAVIEGGTVSADTILISSRSDMVVGTDGVASTFDASSEILLESTEGNVDLRDASISSNLVQISAAAGSLLGKGNLTSTNDIGITVAQDIFAAGIFTDRELTTIAGIGGSLEGSYSVPGTINVDAFSQGVGDANIDAGGDISFGQVSVSLGNDIILLAPNGNVFLGGTTGAENISIFAINVGIGSIDAVNLIDIDADADITGNDAVAGGAIDLAAGGSVDLASLDAGSDVLVDTGGSVTVDAIDAGGDVTIMANGALGVTTLSGGFVDLTSGAVLTVDMVDALRLDATASVLNFGDIAIASNAVATSGSAVLTATAGAISFDTLDADEDVTLSATGNIGFATVTAGGTVTADSGGSLAFTDISGEAIDLTASVMIAGTSLTTPTATAIANDIILDAGGIIDVTTVSASGDVDLTTGGTLTVDTLSGEFLTLAAAQAINLDTITGLGFDATGSSIDFTDATITGSGTVTLVSTSGSINFGSITASGDVDLDANADIVADTGVGTLNAGGEISISAGGSIAVTNLIAGGTLTADGADGFQADTVAAGGNATLRSANGAVVVNTDIAVTGDVIASGAAILLNAANDLVASDVRATNGDIDIVTGGALTVAQAQSVGDINLTSTGGSITAGNLQAGLTTVSPASLGLFLSPFGSAIGSPGQGDITISAATDIVIANDVIAANDLFLSASGLIDIQALATGVAVETSSADMDIGSSGQLGTSDLTQDILIASVGGNTMILGGPAVTGAFSLDADEFGRIYSGGNLTILASAIPGTGPSLIINDLTVQVASGAGGPQDGAIGVGGTLTLVTEGSMRVDGALTLVGADADTVLEMIADQEIRLNAEGGNIAIIDDDEELAGQLNLSAQTIVAATDAAAADIAGASVADADIRLGNSDGIDLDDGFFQARGITFTVNTGLFIQNSAAGTDFADRRGFVVGDGGISIASGSTTPIGIVINGLQEDGLGNRTTGIDMIAQTTIPAAFADDSTINGCLIAAPANCSVTLLPDTPELPDDPVQDLIDEEIEEQPAVEQPTTPLIETVEIYSSREGPIIDDPVTGSGNDDLWIRSAVGGGNDD